MQLIILNCVGLILSTVAGIAVGILLQRYLGRHDLPITKGSQSQGLLADALTYVSGVLGVMLGLLLFFSVQIFEEASTAARDEALSLVDVYEYGNYFPAATATKLQGDTVCLMRSVGVDSWKAAEASDLTGDENTAAWAEVVRQDIAGLPGGTNAEAEAQSSAMASFQSAQNARQSRILSSGWEMPGIIWIVLDLGAAVFAALIIISLPGRRRTSYVIIGSCLVFTMGVVIALSEFATPFTKTGVSVRPTAIEGALVRLQDTYPTQDWSDCPRLAESVIE